MVSLFALTWKRITQLLRSFCTLDDFELCIIARAKKETTNITETKNYGEYIFKIKNYNDQGKLSECDLKYYIEILAKLDNSINIELYQGENKIELHNNKTEFMKIEKNQKEDREYKIKVTYDNENTEVGNDILEKIQIKVHTEQEKA